MTGLESSGRVWDCWRYCTGALPWLVKGLEVKGYAGFDAIVHVVLVSLANKQKDVKNLQKRGRASEREQVGDQRRPSATTHSHRFNPFYFRSPVYCCHWLSFFLQVVLTVHCPKSQ